MILHHTDLIYEASLTIVSVPERKQVFNDNFFNICIFLGEPRKLQTVDIDLLTVIINRKKKESRSMVNYIVGKKECSFF